MTVKMKVLTLSNDDIFYQIRIHFIEYEHFIAWKFHSIENENVIYRMNVRLPVHTRDKNMFCWPIKIQSFDNQTSKFTRHLLTFWRHLRKHLNGGQSLLLSNSYGNFVFCSFENYNERQEIDRGISVGYRLWSFTICRGLKEERVHLNIVCMRGIWQKKIYIFSLKATKD